MLAFPLMSIILPFAAGAVVLVAPRQWRRFCEIASLASAAAVFILVWLCFVKRPFMWPSGDSANALLRIDNLSSFVALSIGFFGVLIVLYSIAFMEGAAEFNKYYAYILWTLGGSIGAAFSNNLILLLGFWGLLALTLYILISIGGPESAYAAKKTFIIVGGSDAVMLLGIAIIWYITGSFNMNVVKISLEGSALAYTAFICLAIAAFAKAGAMPLHTWIPDSSEVAPLPVMAFLPASLDKLLGIYLLARLVLDMFVVVPNSPMSTFLLAVGAITIFAAVMMALIQHNLKKLLSYHAVSQVGYMVLGIGTASPLGIAGGLFHMINHAIYKSCLFLSGGAVEKQTHTTELDELGDLYRYMPITFTTCLVAALSISGVPPLNGFFSKWMIYQSLLEMGKNGGRLWILWLTLAMFGSALTLASFIKLIYAAFLSPRTASDTKPRIYKEVSPCMWIPLVVLAGACVIFGIFAQALPIRSLIAPSVKAVSMIIYPGVWNAPVAAILILTGLTLGLIVYLIGSLSTPLRRTEIFAGGEKLDDASGIKAASFYNTIKEIPLLGLIYRLADRKRFDIYEEGSKITFFLTDGLRWLHNGVLPTYMAWCLLGMIGLFIVFFMV